jgi:predicted lipoprotein with Yx(FWY)xxD motif
MTKKISFSVLVILVVVATACASAPTTTNAPNIPVTGGGTPTTALISSTPAVSGPATLIVGQTSTLGSFLVDGNGLTLYIFTKDQPGISNCSGTCASLWPPLLTNGSPVAGSGVDSSMIGTLTRADGTTQVTYNGWPLYTFTNDETAGDVNGEGYNTFWFVITPTGQQK